ncbi:replication factor C [Babesia caballi]|uniref:Replication factor C n=1 Tax=Babesia caballi TaxID=5871 RepID=A0AAV4LM17_BABCB|nr:replication factor C [Babesia caballi]
MDDFFHGEGLVDDILDEVEADTADLRSAQGPNRLREIAFYPLDSRISNGFSSLRMVDFAQNLAPGGAAGYTSANALYARACEKDKAKLLKSAALLHQGEQFALKASGYRRGNPPLYLKLYKGAHASSAREGDQSECLLGQPIDQLFRHVNC